MRKMMHARDVILICVLYLYNNNNQKKREQGADVFIGKTTGQYWLWSRMQDIEICVGVE